MRRTVTDRFANTEFLPQSSGGKHDTEFEHSLDVDLRDVLCVAGEALACVEHAMILFTRRCSAACST